MANRSHLYTCDEIPGGKGFRARGLSEYGWDIPIVHKLMVATRPRIVRSAIWEHDIALLADREGAFERAIAFFDKLGEGDLGDRKEFDEELAQMKEFLASTPPSKYILLEAGEILDLLGEDLNKLIAKLHAEVSDVAARASRGVAGQEDAWLGELRTEWAEKARPGYWSDILYYSFDGTQSAEPVVEVDDDDHDDDVPEAKPAKAQPAKKPTSASKAAKPAAKTKPAANKAKPAAKAKPAVNKAKPTANKAKPAANKAKPGANKAKPAANKAKPAANKAKKPAAKKPVTKAAKPAARKPAKKRR